MGSYLSTSRRLPETLHSGMEVNSIMDSTKYPNQTLELLFERSSCRSFSDKEIPADVLQLVLEAGIHAASGGNLQPYSIIKIENKAIKQKVAERRNYKFISQAPVLLVFCVDFFRLKQWARLEVAPFSATDSFSHFWIALQDTMICAQTICTAADALGLGSVYLGTSPDDFAEIRASCRLPDGVFPIIMLSLGYPRARPRPKRKLGVDVLVHTEQYHEMTDQEILDAFGGKYPGYRAEVTEERLARISQVCREVHGEEFAKRCVDRIEEAGYINRAQYIFGIHYRASILPTWNEVYLECLKEFGFNLFEKYHPFEDSASTWGVRRET